ncbi:tripartite ATP-independent transporter DctM subunit [Ochrobactrum daejeonense]|uniref:TRAP transporter large permease protein n=1 Tax=Brucella daejeonensis TaxID=659015 RepID=A0A7W9AUF2_9HYPH|nr:TRAP transporter large permease [Brucella daejeonensis]MBB5700803.1 tripartite ATP-independent transporter DctM subunit [Brucella daejeonensis]
MNLTIVILIMLALIALNMRLYVGILVAVFTYFVFFNPMPIAIAVQRFIGPAQNTSLLAIPFFIMLGTVMSHTGIAERMIKVADLLVGRLRGGMALTNIMVSMLMGGVSASNLADSAMLTRMLVPEMEKRGYDRAFSCAVTAAGSLVTPIIPPGIALIIYGLIADVSIGKMFMAGIVPGLLGAAILMFAAYTTSVRRGYKASRDHKLTGAEVRSTLSSAWPALVLIIAILGGIRLNVFTPTEAGAVAVTLVLIIGFVIYREMRVSHVVDSLIETAKSTASVMLVIMASSALAWVFSLEQAGQSLMQLVSSFTDNPYVFLLAINVILLVLGMLIEGTALMIVLVPLLMPTVKVLGIDPVHFGIITIVNLSIGTLTPPVGTVMLMVCNIAKVQVSNFTKQAFSMYMALFAFLLIVTYVPIVSTFLAY